MIENLGLESLNVFAENIVSNLGLDPFTFFVASTVLAVLIILADVKSGFSVKIPGRGQLGLAGAVFALGAVIMILAAEGYQFFLVEIAKQTVSLLIVGVFITWILSRD